MTNHSRDAAVEQVAKFVAKLGEDCPKVIGTQELRERLDRGEPVLLVDVRGDAERRVSMIPGAVSQELFEAEVLPKLKQKAVESKEGGALVVPYCTVGYRSGLYCRELVERHGLSPKTVRNGEGVIMWTFDGSCLVRPLPGEVPQRAPLLRTAGADAPPRPVVGPAGAVPAGESDDEAAQAVPVKQVHVYGKPWDCAAEGYETQFYPPAAAVGHFVRDRLRAWLQGEGPSKVGLWVFVFFMFYLFFTPACGLMYSCGCRVWPSKWGQVETCNVFDDASPHRCPWCSCKGFSCIFVCADVAAFRGMFLLDLLPDGFFVTVFTVVVLVLSWKRVDRVLVGHKLGVRVSLKAGAALLWFVVYCLAMGGIFFAASPDYPFFLGITRNGSNTTDSSESGLGSDDAEPGAVCQDVAEGASDVFVSATWTRSRVNAGEAILMDARESFDGHFRRSVPSQWMTFAKGSGPERSVLKDPATLKVMLAALGVTPAETVVVLGDWASGWGAEGRLYWMLKVLGHPDCYILAGGAQAYSEALGSGAKRAGAHEALPPAHASDWSSELLLEPIAARADMEAVTVDARLRRDPLLVDVRTDGEFDGTAAQGDGAPLYGVARAGHATGAVLFKMEELFDGGACVHSCETFKDKLRDRGWSEGRPLVAYCTGGIRSGFFWAVTHHCGVEDSTNYDGSMWEYAADASLP